MASTRTRPEQAAKVIVDDIKAKRPRALIGSDARLLNCSTAFSVAADLPPQGTGQATA